VEGLITHKLILVSKFVQQLAKETEARFKFQVS
jgi:hypothetical protein